MKKKYVKIGFFLVILIAITLFFLFRNIDNFGGLINGPKENYTEISVKGTNSESCLQCHQNTTGYSAYHNPELIGCTSCHLGNKSSLDKDKAHKGMVLIPGNLVDAEKTCGKCHQEELKKINNSLMTTNSGLVAVDKYIFGEADSPNYHYHIKDIKNSAADKHIRDLCANCHLGAEKKDYGAITNINRGGGCNACHLNYTDKSKADLKNYLSSNKKELPKFHPSTDVFITDNHCFGCHSRSSRISTNYEGWQETLLNADSLKNNHNYRVLEGNRVYTKKQEDVHHAKGMLCIDCHSSHEVMGDGKQYAHEEDAVKLQCADCHFSKKPITIPYDSLDVESLKVFLHRNYSHQNDRILVAKKDKHPLVNTFVDSLGNAFLIGKGDGKLHKLSPRPEVCSRDKVHSDVSCSSCHSSWTSRCIGCHTGFDKNEPRAFDLLDKKYGKGQWKEYVAEFSSSLPAMGVKVSKNKKLIEPAIPGMILTIDKGSYAGKPEGEDVSFHRLYAPNSPHTTTKQVRDCKSCHTNSAAIGYGNGNLNYNIKDGIGIWSFSPDYVLNKNDSLPEDAWIPFLKPVDKKVINSTRLDFRPFTVKEQKQILTVGACLQCHQGNSKIMQESLVKGIKPLLKKINKKRCILPAWK
jgi:hypothetical protein